MADNKKTAKAEVEKVLAAVMQKAGTFVEQPVEARTQEAFSAAGGKLIKTWLSGDEKSAAEIMCLVNGNNSCTVKVAFPVTQPLKKDIADTIAREVLAMAGLFVPGNLSFSPYRRLTLTYQDSRDISEIAELAALLEVRMKEGQNIANALRLELARTDNQVPTFDPKADTIWQSQMGKPVKLSSESLAVLAGGGWMYGDSVSTGQNWITAGASGGGGIVGGTLGSIIPGVGTLTGAAAGSMLGAAAGWGAGSTLTDTPYITDPAPAASEQPTGPTGPRYPYGTF